MTFLPVTDLILKISLFGWFVFSRRHFAEGEKQPTGARFVQIAYIVGLGVNLWLAYVRPEQPSVFSTLGLLMSLLSGAIFYAAVRASKEVGLHVVFSKPTGSSLVSNGIYRHVRHPFYLAYIIYWISWCFTVGFSVVSLLVVGIFLVLYIFSIRLEERQLAQNFGDEYEAYRKRTSLLIPYIL